MQYKIEMTVISNSWPISVIESSKDSLEEAKEHSERCAESYCSKHGFYGIRERKDGMGFVVYDKRCFSVAEFKVI